MMDLPQLLQLCIEKGIKLSCQDENLKVAAAKGTMTKEVAEALKHHKPALIQQMTQQAMSGNTQLPVTDLLKDAPVSFAQKRFWMLHSITPESAAYHIPGSFALSGQLNLKALEAAFRVVIDNRDILRTTYHEQQGHLFQSVNPELNFTMEVMELTQLTDKTVLQEAITAHKHQVFSQPFDLLNGLPVRARVLACPDSHFEVLLCVHHIAADAAAIPLFLHELENSYAAICQGQPQPKRPKHQYIDFAHWQQELAKQGKYQQQLEYWQNKLVNIPQLHEINTDFPRPARHIGKLGTIHKPLAPAFEQQLTAFCQRRKMTVFAFMHTILALLIHRWSGQQHVVVGSPVSGRHLTELEPMLGCFINTLVIANELNSEASLNDLLNQVQQTVQQAMDNQELPFENLVESLSVQRQMAVNPVFQVMLSLNSAGMNQDTFYDLKLHSSPATRSEAKLDLIVNVMTSDSGINMSWQYAEGLFKPQTVQSMADTFEYLLEQVLVDDSQPLASYQLSRLEPQIEVTASKPSTLMVAQFFQHLSENPNQLVLADQRQQWTSQHVSEFIKQVQAWCRQHSLGRGDKVFLALDKTVHTYACVYALWGLGIAYVPIADSIPQQRLQHMADQVQAKAIIFDSELTSSLLPTLGIQGDIQQISTIATTDDLVLSVESDDLAYILFTSGTTGTPKGVCVNQNNLASFITGFSKGIASHSEVLAIDSPLIFDASIGCISMLSQGRTLVALPETSRNDVELLLDILKQHQVDMLFLSTSYLTVLLDNPEFYQRSKISFKFGGEACSQTLWDKVATYCLENDCYALNGYGPTETTVTISCPKVEAGKVPHIGSPFAPNQFQLIDAFGHPCPKGMPGELVIYGPQVSQGYLTEHSKNNAQSNQFVQTTSGIAGYHTGDILTQHNSGEYQFIGRRDDQVKVNGYRIELADIEASVLQHPKVNQVAAKLIEQNQTQYIALFYAGEITPDDISAICQQALPSYMRPHVIQQEIALPLTANRKLDKRQLQLKQAANDAESVLPESGLIYDLAQIWSSQLPPVNLTSHSDFFAIGGHSLAAIKVINEINQQFSLNLPISLLFEFSVLVEFCQSVQSKLATADEQDLLSQLEAINQDQLKDLLEEL